MAWEEGDWIGPVSSWAFICNTEPSTGPDLHICWASEFVGLSPFWKLVLRTCDLWRCGEVTSFSLLVFLFLHQPSVSPLIWYRLIHLPTTFS